MNGILPLGCGMGRFSSGEIFLFLALFYGIPLLGIIALFTYFIRRRRKRRKRARMSPAEVVAQEITAQPPRLVRRYLFTVLVFLFSCYVLVFSIGFILIIVGIESSFDSAEHLLFMIIPASVFGCAWFVGSRSRAIQARWVYFSLSLLLIPFSLAIQHLSWEVPLAIVLAFIGGDLGDRHRAKRLSERLKWEDEAAAPLAEESA